MLESFTSTPIYSIWDSRLRYQRDFLRVKWFMCRLYF